MKRIQQACKGAGLTVFLFAISSAAAGAFDLPIIAGFGTLFDFNTTSYRGDRTYEDGLKGEVAYNMISTGGFLFFDFKYAEASIGFNGILNYIDGNEALKEVTRSDWPDANLSGAAVVLALNAKFPFEFPGYQVYPLLGIEGRICVSMRYQEDSIWDQKKAGDSYQGDAADWSSFWIRIGAGADFYLGSSLFIRTELTFGYKFNTAREIAILKLIDESELYKQVSSFGAGGKLVLALGYNFGETSFNLPSGGSKSSKNNEIRRNKRPSGGPDVYYPY